MEMSYLSPSIKMDSVNSEVGGPLGGPFYLYLYSEAPSARKTLLASLINQKPSGFSYNYDLEYLNISLESIVILIFFHRSEYEIY